MRTLHLAALVSALASCGGPPVADSNSEGEGEGEPAVCLESLTACRTQESCPDGRFCFLPDGGSGSGCCIAAICELTETCEVDLECNPTFDLDCPRERCLLKAGVFSCLPQEDIEPTDCTVGEVFFSLGSETFEPSIAFLNRDGRRLPLSVDHSTSVQDVSCVDEICVGEFIVISGDITCQGPSIIMATEVLESTSAIVNLSESAVLLDGASIPAHSAKAITPGEHSVSAPDLVILTAQPGTAYVVEDRTSNATEYISSFGRYAALVSPSSHTLSGIDPSLRDYSTFPLASSFFGANRLEVGVRWVTVLEYQISGTQDDLDLLASSNPFDLLRIFNGSHLFGFGTSETLTPPSTPLLLPVTVLGAPDAGFIVWTVAKAPGVGRVLLAVQVVDTEDDVANYLAGLPQLGDGLEGAELETYSSKRVGDRVVASPLGTPSPSLDCSGGICVSFDATGTGTPGIGNGDDGGLTFYFQERPHLVWLTEPGRFFREPSHWSSALAPNE